MQATGFIPPQLPPPQRAAAPPATVRRPRARNAGAIAACAVMLCVFAAVAFSAVVGKSATYDETLHSVASYMHRYYHDFRINTEDPALLGYIAMLPHGPHALAMSDDPIARKVWDNLPNIPTAQWQFVVYTLYRTPGNNADAFLNRTRFVFVLVGVLLGALIGWWAWRLGGAVAAVGAVAAFALDPNFMAHGALVKNDVPTACVMLGLFFAVWACGRRVTWPRVAAVALLCGAVVTIKFSGLICGPLAAALLVGRAVAPRPWHVLGRELGTTGRRLAAVLILGLGVAAVAYAFLWGCYLFRFEPTPQRGVLMNSRFIWEITQVNQTIEKHAGRVPTTQELDEWKPGAFLRAIDWVERHRLLPQSWLVGLLYTYATTRVRSTYLLGEISNVGWWYYFPLTMLFKTPAATLAASVASVGVAWAAVFGRRRTRPAEGEAAAEDPYRAPRGWTAACLVLPPLVYLGVAMAGNLNLGLRHVLPVYPFLFIAIGVAAASAWARWRTMAAIGAGVLLVGLAAETFSAYPDYIPFFNTFAGGSRGGLHLLGDSNLDWGQDLRLVAKWQQENPGEDLSLCYFGTADPGYYHIRYTNLPGGYLFGPTQHWPTRPGVWAVSATALQGIYTAKYHDVYGRLLDEKPLEVLGGSIYLYRVGGPSAGAGGTSRPASP